MIPVFLAVLIFLTREQVVEAITCTFAALIASIYFLHFSFVSAQVSKETSAKGRMMMNVSKYTLSLLCIFSVFYLITVSKGQIIQLPVKYFLLLLSVVNIFLLYYFHFREKDSRLFLNHQLFMLLPSISVFG